MMNEHETQAHIKTRQQQLHHEAEQWRLRSQDQQEKTPFYAPLLARTGILLSQLGDQLQDRYSRIELQPVKQTEC